MTIIDDLLAATAASQHALLTRPQVLAAGGSDSLIRRRTASGRWERVGRGVFAITGVPWTWRRRLCAILLALGSHAVVSHRAAAKLLGAGGAGEPPYEFSVPVDRAPRPVPAPPHARPDEVPVVIHESIDLHHANPVRVDGILVTAPARLAVDLGSVISFRRYRSAVARIRSDHGVSWLDLERQYRRHSIQGRNGCGALRDLLDLEHEEAGAPDEVVEALLGDLLADAGLPAPLPQFPVQRPDGRMAYIDLAYPDLFIAIETEGRVHLREDVHQADHERRNQLVLAGWTVLHFTYADVTRRPNEVVATIKSAIERRAEPATRISL